MIHEGEVREPPFEKVFGGQPRNGSGVEAQLHRLASAQHLSKAAERVPALDDGPVEGRSRRKRLEQAGLR